MGKFAVTLKTLKNDKFVIELDEDMTIADAKKQIAVERNFELSSVKLIFKGKILTDDTTVGQSIKPDAVDFVVVMGKPAAGDSGAAPKPSASPAAAVAASPAAAQPAAQPAAQVPAAARPAGDGGAPSVGSQGQIDELVSMGFAREDVIVALRAAFGNTNRATEYLLNPGSMPAAGAAQEPDAMEAEVDPGDGDDEGPEPLAQNSPLYPLLNNPHFMQIRRLVHQRPELLPSLLAEMARQQPELVAMLNSNREDLYRLLNMPVAMPGGGGGGGGGGNAAAGGARGGGAQIAMSAEDREAIDRLCALVGPQIDRMVVIQAYIACDRNEQIAANYLFENQFD